MSALDWASLRRNLDAILDRLLDGAHYLAEKVSDVGAEMETMKAGA
jgi:hypothetical protein